MIGWREWLSLPALAIPHIKCKIDTGARTSALHAYFLEPFTDGDRRRVRFGIHPFQRRTDAARICVADVLEERMVSDSGGHRERRLVIRTPVELGGQRWDIEISLTARDSMRFRMLLGRTAIQHRFTVDPAASYLCGRPQRRRTRHR